MPTERDMDDEERDVVRKTGHLFKAFGFVVNVASGGLYGAVVKGVFNHCAEKCYREADSGKTTSAKMPDGGWSTYTNDG
jgi:hypothetical protein